MFHAYYRLAKPGIIYGNVITGIAGYLFGSHWQIDYPLLGATAFGTALVIAASCVLNNLLDHKIDRRMERTRERALVTGTVSRTAALVYAGILGAAGFTLLALWSRPIVIVIGIIAVVDYVVLYGLAKRTTTFSTWVGSISGSASLVAGYCAATNHFDLTALLIGLALALWQMGHFYGIALYRQGDYAAAGLPVMPVVWGVRSTKLQTIGYIGLFALCCCALAALGYAGQSFFGLMLITSLVWFWRAIHSRYRLDGPAWGRRVFLDSLIVNLLLSVGIATATVLP